ncbi:MAG: GxxExxY protein, partial [Bacteroidetes bacterium HGW-Bacteroidetes-22]
MYIHEDLTESVIKWFYKVYNTLGYGFLEKVYHNALVHELQKQGFECKSQYAIKVVYDNLVVGEYFADILVNDVLLLELKAAEVLCEEHEFQLINY